MKMLQSQKHDQQKNNNVYALLFAVLFVISVLWAQVAIAWTETRDALMAASLGG